MSETIKGKSTSGFELHLLFVRGGASEIFKRDLELGTCLEIEQRDPVYSGNFYHIPVSSGLRPSLSVGLRGCKPCVGSRCSECGSAGRLNDSRAIRKEGTLVLPLKQDQLAWGPDCWNGEDSSGPSEFRTVDLNCICMPETSYILQRSFY